MNKFDLIESGKYKEYKDIKRIVFRTNSNDDLLKALDLTKDDLVEQILVMNNNYTFQDVEECERIYNCEHLRKKRNFDNILKWIFAIKYLSCCKDKKIIFGTLTFTNKVLDKTSDLTRRRYITRYLKDYCFNYIANIDFGDKNGREHYHFLALVDKNKTKENDDAWKYGFSYLEDVKIENNSLYATKNYLLKLNNHSFKDSNKQKSVIKDKNPFIENYIKLICPDKYKKFKVMFLDNLIDLKEDLNIFNTNISEI